ncbi:MAG: hypothetical protein KJ771_00580, partial [Nanoarchaeota archaeon]|nr:hypothetical protein [Nanoarchaeota archaeon]
TKSMRIVIFSLLILFFVVGCTSNIAGVPAERNTIPCSSGTGCNFYDALGVDGEAYFLVKDIFNENEEYTYQRDEYECHNSVCAVYCQDDQCYLKDKAGNTYVRGKIVNDPDAANSNLKNYILVKS